MSIGEIPQQDGDNALPAGTGAVQGQLPDTVNPGVQSTVSTGHTTGFDSSHVAQSPAAGATVNPFEVDETPSLPPRPDANPDLEHAMATVPIAAPAPQPQVLDATTPDHVNPEVESLRAMFPDFDAVVLQSVLESVNNDQERALDVLLGMSDPEYSATQTDNQVGEAQQSIDLDEQLARQLLLEDEHQAQYQQQQQQQQQRRHATGNSWPRRGEGDVPYQTRQHAPQAEQARPAQSEGKTDLQELQRTMGQIAESGKRTFSSIVSKVKAKINEYDQSRNAGQSSQALTAPQWGNAPPPQLGRHTASQAYQQYFGSGRGPEPSPPAVDTHQIALGDPPRVQGYDIDAPAPTIQSQPPLQTPPIAAPIPTPAAHTAAATTSPRLSPSASPRPSSDVPRPPRTVTGSPVNLAKIGLLPKRPVSLLTTNSPPATGPSDDDELEYVENPFEEHK